MGCSPFANCSTNYSAIAPAPNPDPEHWTLMWVVRYKNAYVLKVKYHDCTNFEGMKIMVYRGQYTAVPKTLDPHFTKGKKSPIARFPPTVEGIAMAKALAKSLR